MRQAQVFGSSPWQSTQSDQVASIRGQEHAGHFGVSAAASKAPPVTAFVAARPLPASAVATREQQTLVAPVDAAGSNRRRAGNPISTSAERLFSISETKAFTFTPATNSSTSCGTVGAARTTKSGCPEHRSSTLLLAALADHPGPGRGPADEHVLYAYRPRPCCTPPRGVCSVTGQRLPQRACSPDSASHRPSVYSLPTMHSHCC